MSAWRSVKLILKGFFIGTADLIPGVSGGTIAWILKIYPELIYAIRAFDKKWLAALWHWNLPVILGRPNFKLLIPLGVGILGAVFFFTRIIPLPLLLQTHPESIYALFFGLISGSIITLVPMLKKFHIQHALILFSGLLLGALTLSVVPQETPDTAAFIFLCGVLAISAMLLPGLSGSLILLLLQKYSYIFHAIGTLQFTILLPFTLGALIGLISISRLLAYLLQRYYELLLSFIIGLLTASLWTIWPFQQHIIIDEKQLVQTMPYLPNNLSSEVGLAIAMGILGGAIILLLHYLSGLSHNK